MAAEKTEYMILRALPPVDDDDIRFELVASKQPAHSSEHAIRDYVAIPGSTGSGEYVAVPCRSWNLTKVTLETQTVVKLGDAA